MAWHGQIAAAPGPRPRHTRLLLALTRVDQAEALTAVDGFLRAPIDGRRDTWQARLRDPQHHGPARRARSMHTSEDC